MPTTGILNAQHSSALGGCQSRADENTRIHGLSGSILHQTPRTAPATQRQPAAQGSIAARYGGLGLRHGFVPLPVSLQHHRRRLGLTAALLDLIAALLSCGRGRALPHPSIAWLGARLGVDERTVQRRVRRLVALGHLVVSPRRTATGRQGANAYDLQPLLVQVEVLDAQQTGTQDCQTRGVAVAPPAIEQRDLDPMEVPPTPTVQAICPAPIKELSGTPLAYAPPTSVPLAGGKEYRPAKGAAAPRAASEQPSDGPRQAVRLALTPILAPILTRYQESAPAAALAQFAGLQQYSHLSPHAFAQALAEAERHLEVRLRAEQQALLGSVRRPVAYLYGVLRQLLAERAAPVSVPPDPEPVATARVRTAVTRLATELGAPHPASCGSRAVKLLRQSSLAPEVFWDLLREAACQTRQCAIRATRTDGRPNAMPLFFTILNRLLKAPGVRATNRGLRRRTRWYEHGLASRVPCPAPAITEPHPIWRGVLAELRAIMTPANFARCLATQVVGQDGDLLQVSVPSARERHWFDTCIRRRVEEAVAARGHPTVRVQFVAARMSPGPALAD